MSVNEVLVFYYAFGLCNGLFCSSLFRARLFRGDVGYADTPLGARAGTGKGAGKSLEQPKS